MDMHVHYAELFVVKWSARKKKDFLHQKMHLRDNKSQANGFVFAIISCTSINFWNPFWKALWRLHQWNFTSNKLNIFKLWWTCRISNGRICTEMRWFSICSSLRESLKERRSSIVHEVLFNFHLHGFFQGFFKSECFHVSRGRVIFIEILSFAFLSVRKSFFIEG